MPEYWNLQTNIKAKPNSQGTLFSGGTSQMNPERRYKRGYTPERQKAVNDAVRVLDVTQNEWEPDRNSPRAREVQEQIKRSSVPVSDLKHLRVTIMRPEHPLALDTLRSANGYYVGHGEGSFPRGEITLKPDAKGPTVIHEIGHHASNLADTPHTRSKAGKGRSVQQTGEEEGFADTYADKHMPAYNRYYRHPDRFHLADQRGRADYTPSRRQQTDPSGSYRPEAFREGYQSMRPMESRVPNRDDRWRDDSAAFHAKRAPKQETLF